MRIKVTIYPNKREKYVIIEGKEKVRVSKVLNELGLNEYLAVPVKDGIPLTGDDVLRDGDEIEVYEVISTG